MTEEGMAGYVVTWLKDFPGFEVYEEVSMGSGEPRPDIVVKIPYKSTSLYWIVETKLSLSTTLLAQVVEHVDCRRAHYVSVAYRKGSGAARYAKPNQFKRRILDHWGIGAIEVSDGDVPNFSPIEIERPRFYRKLSPYTNVGECLLEAQKSGVSAGTRGGGYTTPFRETCSEIARYLRANPGASIKEVVEHDHYHWRTPTSAKVCIAKYAREGVLHGVRCEVNGRKIKLFAIEEETN